MQLVMRSGLALRLAAALVATAALAAFAVRRTIATFGAWTTITFRTRRTRTAVIAAWARAVVLRLRTLTRGMPLPVAP